MAERRHALSERLPRLSTSRWIALLVGLLCVVGLMMVASASSIISINYYGSAWSIASKELLWVSSGAVVMFVMARWDYHKVARLSPLLIIGTMGALLVVLIPGIGTTSGGSTRWIGFGPFMVQPSELMKLALALFGAHLIAGRMEKSTSMRYTVLPVAILAAIACALVVKQPDLGTALVLVVITSTLAFSAGLPMRLLGRWLLLIIGLVTLAAVVAPYRRDRLLSFMNPGAKSSEGGYQVVQSLIGLGSGGPAGLGLGHSREKWGLLPNAHTDFIFSVIGEELGIIGALVIIVLVAALAIKGWKAAEQAPDRLGLLLGAAIVAWISAEAVINIGAVLGLLPVTGIPLPFVSYGGTSMVITMAAAGILINIARHERAPMPPRPTRSRKAATAGASGPARRKSVSHTDRRPAGPARSR